MKRFLSVILVMLVMVSLVACGEKEETSKNDVVSLDLPAMYSQMEAKLPEMVALDSEEIHIRYGVSPDFVSEAIVYVCKDGLRADEIWLMKAANAESMEKLEQFAQFRMQAKDEESVTYSPEQNKVVKQGKILKRGDYLALIVTPEVESVAGIFNG